MLTLTPAAIIKIKNLSSSYLRIDIMGGGCAGFQYQFSLESNKNIQDIEVSADGAHVLIDSAFESMLSGCVLDFETNLTGSRFKISNPNAVSGCGCGNSFAV